MSFTPVTLWPFERFLVAILAISLPLLFAILKSRIRTSPRPPTLADRIPYVTNTIQYLTNAGAFIDRVKEKLAKSRHNIIKFHVSLMPVYIVTGSKNVQKVLTASPTLLDGNFLQLMLMDAHWGLSPSEINKWAQDKTGRSKTPMHHSSSPPMDESKTPSNRYWYTHNQLYVDYLSNKRYSDALAKSFNQFFTERLDKICPAAANGELQSTAEVQLFSTLKQTMTEAATISLFGTQIIDLNPGLVDAYWEFDDVAGRLAWGLPRFLQQKQVAIKDRLHAMTRRHIDSAWENIRWNDVADDLEWEPHFGSRLSRETAKWFRANGFSDQGAAGHTLASLFGLNGNTVPVTMWAMIELIQDRELLDAVREEVQSACGGEDSGGEGLASIDIQKLVNLPLMQSLYVEIMRMHVSFNITRKTTEPMMIDGFWVEKGALVQTCSQIAHFEEEVWGEDGHPASEFWAWRHIKRDGDGKMQSAMKGRPTSFFPYGGGHVMCPGRHFAKQEILLAITLLITKFDIEFVGWTTLDGSTPSERPPLDDKRFAGFVAMSPDGDVTVRLRRRM